jgi:hypothetical protein
MAAGSLMSKVALSQAPTFRSGFAWIGSRGRKDLEGTLHKLYAFSSARSNCRLLRKIRGRPGLAVQGHRLHSPACTPARMPLPQPDQIIADAKTLGLKYIICSSPMSDAAKAKLEG